MTWFLLIRGDCFEKTSSASDRARADTCILHAAARFCARPAPARSKSRSKAARPRRPPSTPCTATRSRWPAQTSASSGYSSNKNIATIGQADGQAEARRPRPDVKTDGQEHQHGQGRCDQNVQGAAARHGRFRLAKRADAFRRRKRRRSPRRSRRAAAQTWFASFRRQRHRHRRPEQRQGHGREKPGENDPLPSMPKRLWATANSSKYNKIAKVKVTVTEAKPVPTPTPNLTGVFGGAGARPSPRRPRRY